MMTDNLNLLVTEAIMRADTLADLGSPTAADAYREVSLLEERLADTLPASDAFGAIARRGAVRAACAAGDDARARALAAQYLADEDASRELRAEITALIEERDKSLATRHSHAAARLGVADVLHVTRELVRQPAAFPVA